MFREGVASVLRGGTDALDVLQATDGQDAPHPLDAHAEVSAVLLDRCCWSACGAICWPAARPSGCCCCR